jgi:endonuclease/exonuclease/phosphatase family metal-dependent hydrolase
MNRRAFLAGVGALSLGIPRLGGAVEEGPRLRVVTYNIHHAEGSDGRLDLDRIAGVLRELDADVVCLQEVDRNQPRTERLDMPALLTEKLGMASAYGVNYQFSGGDYGVLTLTRLPLLSQRNTPLANPEGVAEPRGCLTVTVRWQDREVDIHNTHLGLSPKERAAQVADILPLIRPDTPTLLLGDLNEGPDAPAVARLREKLADTFTGPKDEGSLPGAKKARRIDFILASNHFEATESVVHMTDTTRVASDHFPCRAVLAWRDSVAATP